MEQPDSVNMDYTNDIEVNHLEEKIKQSDEELKIQRLKERPYQTELLMEAKKRNIIVYLGTGSGKTFIATMLIKEMRAQFGSQKAVFLVSSVPLVEQQATFISNTTGLSVGSYCGASGVDDWDEAKWKDELSKHSVLVLVHQVFLDLMSHFNRLFSLSNVDLLIMDECHHAVKKHPYKKIMSEWYHPLKEAGKHVPKVLGLTACIVVKTVNVEQFRREKLDLEKTMDAEVATTHDLPKILEFVTNPDESIERYRVDSEENAESQILAIADWAETEIMTVKQEELANITKSDLHITLQQTVKDNLDNDVKLYKNEVFGNLKYVLTNLGLTAIVENIEDFKDTLKTHYHKASKDYQNQKAKSKIHDISEKAMKAIEDILIRKVDQFKQDKLEKIRRFSSSKVLKLLDLLKKDTVEGHTEKMRSIIFVDRKFTAQVLSNILDEISFLDPSYYHLKVDYTFSPGKKLSVKDKSHRVQINTENKDLFSKLKRFRNGDINVLISTSVVEEGLDVRNCNYIIKFDFPNTFRSYVQSKGRARAKPSNYILLVPDGKDGDNLQNKWDEYKQLEKISVQECLGSSSDDQVLNDPWEVEFYMAEPSNPNSARVDGSQAIGLVYRYIQSIPVDRYTQLTPAWQINDVQPDAQKAYLLSALGMSEELGFRAVCYMPHKTPLKEPIAGSVRLSKDGAKRSCALEIIRLLHEAGELDSKLKIVRHSLVEEDDDDDDDFGDTRGRKLGTRKRRKFYHQTMPQLLQLDQNCPEVYVHKIEMKLIEPLENARYKIYDPYEDPQSLCILLSQKLPSMGPFDFHGPSGKLHVNIKCIGKMNIVISENMLSFHRFIFSTVLRMDNKDFMDFCNDSLLIIPLLKCKSQENIDGYLIEKVASNKSKKINVTGINHYRQKEVFDQVVFPTYRRNDNYFVEEVCTQLKANSKMPGSGITFMEHYRLRYQVEIQDPAQPLLCISSADKRKYMLLKEGDMFADKGAPSGSTKFVPELMLAHPLPAGVWRQAQILPFVLYRMKSILAANELKNRICGKEKNVQRLVWKPHNDSHRKDREVRKDLMRLEKNYELNACDLVEALTLNGTNDIFDMERMEILGDCFLKYATSTFLFYHLKTPNEGILTTNRSKIVGNKNLYKVAENLNLANRYILSAKMEPHSSWLPHGYSTKKLEKKLIELDEKFPNYITKKKSSLGVGSFLSYVAKEDFEKVMKGEEDEVLKLAAKRWNEDKNVQGMKLREYRLVADKSCADCVESIIGCFLLKTGQSHTLKVMARMGIDLTPSSTLDDLLERKKKDQVSNVEFTPLKDGFINDFAREDTVGAAGLYDKLGVEEIERKIGYSFKEKSFLLQAFTHSSYGENRLTESYEVLEFLGDAVLDYLVTIYIYSSTEADPGKLTDIRSALVCNNMFASLLVDAGLNPFILHSSPLIQSKINSYLDDKANVSHIEDYVERNNQLINETEPPELEMVEVPKILGDVLEALVGAVYIDSGHDLFTVWKIYRRLCPQLDAVVENPPGNIKDVLHKKFPETVKFGKASRKVDEDQIRVVVRVGDGKEFIGLGRNKKMATLAACKCALRKLGLSEYAATTS